MYNFSGRMGYSEQYIFSYSFMAVLVMIFITNMILGTKIHLCKPPEETEGNGELFNY